MYYRVTILKGKPEMAEKGYALLDENRAKLEAMPGIEHIRLFEADDYTSVVIACHESQKACEAVTAIVNDNTRFHGRNDDCTSCKTYG